MFTRKPTAAEIVERMEASRRVMDASRVGAVVKENKVREHGQYEDKLTFTSEKPPQHLCPRHGEHPRWITLYGYGERLPAYCMDCVVNLLDREQVGRVILKE